MRKIIHHFLDLDQIHPNILKAILGSAHYMKKESDGNFSKTNPEVLVLQGKRLVFISEKPSTRTRFSFRAAIEELGGTFDAPAMGEMQLDEKETIEDTARVISNGYVDGIVYRTSDPENLVRMAMASTVPVINGLTNDFHPCQVMADIMTMQERLGPDLKGFKVVWAGDGNNNVLNSLIHATPVFGYKLWILCPQEYMPRKDILEAAEKKGGWITYSHTVTSAKNADVVFTDVWASMHDKDKEEVERRIKLMTPFRVNDRFMALAKPDAFVLHCMPVNRGQELTSDIMDGPQSAIWDEAANRKHVQKAILRWALA